MFIHNNPKSQSTKTAIRDENFFLLNLIKIRDTKISFTENSFLKHNQNKNPIIKKNEKNTALVGG